MTTKSSSRFDFNQQEVEDRHFHQRPSVIRVPSEAESINSLDYQHTLLASLDDLSKVRHPVQHQDRSYVGQEANSSQQQFHANHSPEQSPAVLSDHSSQQLEYLPSTDESFVIDPSLNDSNIFYSDHATPAQCQRRPLGTQSDYSTCDVGANQSRPCNNDDANRGDYNENEIGLRMSLMGISGPPLLQNQSLHGNSNYPSSSYREPFRNGNRQMFNQAYGSRVGQIQPHNGIRQGTEMAYPIPQPLERRQSQNVSSNSSQPVSHDSDKISGFVTMHPSFEEQESAQKPQKQSPPQPPSSHQSVPIGVSTTNCAPSTSSTRPYRTPVPQASTSTNREQIKVFITYAKEPQNPLHIRTVVQISQTLMNNSIEVVVDVLEENVQAMSISDWLENNIRNSNFILICISPEYHQVIERQAGNSFTNLQEDAAVNTQYIYRRIHTEYIKNGSRNFRFIPVLVSNACITDIPEWLRDTKVFEWPKDYSDIIYRLFRQEKFVKPPIGEPPVHTVKYYNADSDGKDRKDSESSSQTRPKSPYS